MEGTYFLLVFDSTHAAIAAQRALEPLLPVRVVPTLRQIAATCGISLRVEAADLDRLTGAMERGAVPAGDCRLYQIEGPKVRPVTKGGG